MPLSMAKTGETGCIKRISGRDEVRQYLAQLGFVVGEQVTVVTEMGGSLILEIKGSRVALGRQMANRVVIV